MTVTLPVTIYGYDHTCDYDWDISYGYDYDITCHYWWDITCYYGCDIDNITMDHIMAFYFWFF